jgi:hypothetical protein
MRLRATEREDCLIHLHGIAAAFTKNHKLVGILPSQPPAERLRRCSKITPEKAKVRPK